MPTSRDSVGPRPQGVVPIHPIVICIFVSVWITIAQLLIARAQFDFYAIAAFVACVLSSSKLFLMRRAWNKWRASLGESATQVITAGTAEVESADAASVISGPERGPAVPSEIATNAAQQDSAASEASLAGKDEPAAQAPAEVDIMGLLAGLHIGDRIAAQVSIRGVLLAFAVMAVCFAGFLMWPAAKPTFLQMHVFGQDECEWLVYRSLVVFACAAVALVVGIFWLGIRTLFVAGVKKGSVLLSMAMVLVFIGGCGYVGFLNADDFNPVNRFGAQQRKMRQYVFDREGILADSTRRILNGMLDACNASTQVEFVVLVMPTTGAERMSDFKTKTFNDWALGDRERDDGLLMVVATQSRRIGLEVGYGLEGDLPDAWLGRAIDDQAIPSFKSNRIDEGILKLSAYVVDRLEERHRMSQSVITGDSSRAMRQGGVSRVRAKALSSKDVDDWIPTFILLPLFGLFSLYAGLCAVWEALWSSVNSINVLYGQIVLDWPSGRIRERHWGAGSGSTITFEPSRDDDSGGGSSGGSSGDSFSGGGGESGGGGAERSW